MRVRLAVVAAVAAVGLLASTASVSAAAGTAPGTVVWPVGPNLTSYTAFTAPGARPLIGHFGPDRDDVVWYTPGPGGDSWWKGNGDRTFTKVSISVGGTYEPVVADLTGDGVDDIYWWARSGTDSLWDFNADGSITKRNDVQVDLAASPVVGSFGSGTKERIFFYGPGTAPDRLLSVTDAGSSVASYTINGTYTVVPGRLWGQDPNDPVERDLLLYAPGTAGDYIWHFKPDGTVAQRAITVNGSYKPVVGDFTYDGADDIIWYGPGSKADGMWDLNSNGSVTSVTVSIGGTYEPLVCRCRPDMSALEDVVWFAPSYGSDSMWNFGSVDGINVTRSSTPIIVEHDRAVTGGDLDADGQHDIVTWD